MINTAGLHCHAEDRYRDLGWPLHEAEALELAGRSDAALTLYRACGSVVDVRRLEMRRPETRSRNAGSRRLSPRERDVAALVAHGLSNRAIAQALCITEKTVEKYVSAIYAKLSFSTRSQLAAHVALTAASEHHAASSPTERSVATQPLSRR